MGRMEQFSLKVGQARAAPVLAVLLVLVAVALVGCSTPGGQSRPDLAEASQANAELAFEYLRRGRLDPAVQLASKALEQDPNSPSAALSYALVQERLGKLDLAERYYQRAIRLDPDFSQAHNNYGQFLCRLERFEEAEQQFLKALDNPRYSAREVALTNAGRCVRDREQAREYLRLALQARRDFPQALYFLAEMNLDEGNYEQAREYVQRFHEAHQFHPKTLWVAIQAERALGEKDAVATHSLLLRNRFPDSPEARQLKELEADFG